MVPKAGGKAGETILNTAYVGTTIGRLANALFVAAPVCLVAAFLLFPYYRAREAESLRETPLRLGGVRSRLDPAGPHLLRGLSPLRGGARRPHARPLGLGVGLLTLAAQQAGIGVVHWDVVLAYSAVAPVGGTLCPPGAGPGSGPQSR